MKWMERISMASILYVSSCCSSDYFFHLMKNSCGMQQQAQKFHSLLLEGFSSTSAQKDVSVQTLSAPPITKGNTHKLRIPSCQMTVGNIAYNHLPVLNIPYIKNLYTLLSGFFQTRHFGKVSYKPVVICDVLNISISIGALIAAKLQGIPTVGIVTDVPKFLSNNPNGFGTRLNTTLMNSFDSYVLLTEAMTEVVNCKNKPYTVIEGQVDINMADMPNLLTDKYEKKVCLYAGGLQRIYGIPYLVQAFLKADVPDAELHIYGSGDYQEELIELCQQHPSIRYFGVKPNSDVVQAEISATLLINPRPTTEEYTKYS
ncbi:MAG: glycosyltransferase, partial [Clostridia bacterium]